MADRQGRLLVIAFLSLCMLSCVESWVPRIINGRPKGGMLGAPKAPSGFRDYPEKYFTQFLNHFVGADFRTWQQRYFVNDTFYKAGGPIFVMIGGEGPANPVWMVEGTWIQLAQKYNALCLMLEHRFYGKSHPVEDLSLKNIIFLESVQALADLAYFIKSYREDNNLHGNKLITFGGSYPGSLSAWFRSKYPNIVDGAVATSAPIYAQLDFKEYLGVVTDSLSTTGPKCNFEIYQATQTLAQWWNQTDKLDDLKTMFTLCDKIDQSNALDKATLFSNLAGNFEGVVQYNKDNRAFEGAVGTDIILDTLCDIMNDESRGSSLQRYADVNTLMLKTYSQSCLDFTYDKMIDSMKEVSWNSSASEGGRQWMYQTCAEFGWYQSSDSKQPFGDVSAFSVDYSCRQCTDIFGVDFSCQNIEKNVEGSNQYYGGRNISVTKVVFPNGSIDPWHAMGVTQDISPNATAIYINGTAHCANMYPERDEDVPELKAARQKISDLVAKWIA